jgi:hypothetical protein
MRLFEYTPFNDLTAHQILNLYRCIHTRHLYLIKRHLHRLDPDKSPRNNPVIAHYSGYWVATTGQQLTIDDAISHNTKTRAASTSDVQSFANAAGPTGA